MTSSYTQQSDSSEEEDRFEQDDDYRGKNGLLFVVDFRKEMLSDSGNNSSFFRKAIEACKDVMLHIGRSGKDDLVGIVLFGTEKSDIEGITFVAELQCMSSVSANRILDLNQIIVDRGESLVKKYGHTDSGKVLNLFTVLKTCQQLFLNCKSKIYNKSMLMMSSDDDPCKGDVRAAHLARKRAYLLRQLNIELNVISMGTQFDSTKFYNELVYISRGETTKDWRQTDRVKNLDDMTKEIISVMTRLSRTYRNLTFSERLSIPVALYKFYKEPVLKLVTEKILPQLDSQPPPSMPAPPPPVPAQPPPVPDQPTATTPQCTVSAEMYYTPSKTEFYPMFSGRVIKMDRGTLEGGLMKTGVGLSVLGFMATSQIPQYLSVEVPRIMVPNYTSKGGSEAFVLLVEECLRRQVSIICWYMYNRNSMPSLVACHPMPSVSHPHTGQLCPQGFCVVRLPFDDEYSDPEGYTLEGVPSDSQVEAATEIVNQVTAKYTPSMFHDNELHKLTALTEALALGYDEPQQVEDDTEVDLESIDDAVKGSGERLMDCSHLGMVRCLKKPATTSRGPPAKVPRSSSQNLYLIANQQAHKMTVAELRSLLEEHSHYAPPSYRKQQLIDLVYEKIKPSS